MDSKYSSLFTSPSFIAVEAGFLFVASIAAYELFVGDFVWAHDEEARRKSQSRRGREIGDHGVGYEPLDGRQLYRPRRDYDRSLSPGRGGRVTRGLNASSRREPANAGIGNQDGGGDRIEDGYYTSPGGRGSPGKGSTGDTTRRLFYKLILAALLSRFFLLPLETYCFSSKKNFESTSLRILLRICQTLPDIAFASALSLLVIFCAQIAFAALPPLPDRSSDAFGDEDDAETEGAGEEKEDEEDDMAGYDGLLSIGKLHQLKENEENDQSNKPKKRIHWGRAICMPFARCTRAVLAAKQAFAVWNATLLLSYTVLIIFALVVPLAALPLYESFLWVLLAVAYSLLLVSLFYVGALLGKALRPGMERRQDANSLAHRLLGTCLLLTWIFSERLVSFSLVAHNSVGGVNGMLVYKRDALQYATSELLPVLVLLLLMHRKRIKERQQEPVMIHSFMNSIFGSSGWLGSSDAATADASITTAASCDAVGSTAPVGSTSGLGSRRFKTYGGTTRGDSFPPVTGNRQGGQQNIARVASSSGETGGGSKPKQQFSKVHGLGGNATNQEHSKLIGGGPKTAYGTSDLII